MTSQSIVLPDEAEGSEYYLLRQEIPALQLLATENGHARWGPMIRLPRGAHLCKLGRGFDDQTLLVRFGDSFYIIFNQDLAESQKPNKLRKHAQTA